MRSKRAAIRDPSRVDVCAAPCSALRMTQDDPRTLQPERFDPWSRSNPRYSAAVPDDPAVETIRGRGLRVTAQRVAVLRAVSREPHTTADAIAERVRSEIGAISVQAVYDALGALTDASLVRRIQPSGSPARFETRVGDNHHHAICRKCGRMADVDCTAGDAPCLTAADDHGFEIDEAEVIYWGRCPECAREETRT